MGKPQNKSQAKLKSRRDRWEKSDKRPNGHEHHQPGSQNLKKG